MDDLLVHGRFCLPFVSPILGGGVPYRTSFNGRFQTGGQTHSRWPDGQGAKRALGYSTIVPRGARWRIYIYIYIYIYIHSFVSFFLFFMFIRFPPQKDWPASSWNCSRFSTSFSLWQSYFCSPPIPITAEHSDFLRPSPRRPGWWGQDANEEAGRPSILTWAVQAPKKDSLLPASDC